MAQFWLHFWNGPLPLWRRTIVIGKLLTTHQNILYLFVKIASRQTLCGRLMVCDLDLELSSVGQSVAEERRGTSAHDCQIKYCPMSVCPGWWPELNCLMSSLRQSRLKLDVKLFLQPRHNWFEGNPPTIYYFCKTKSIFGPKSRFPYRWC